jgi:hypothetical protein
MESIKFINGNFTPSDAQEVMLDAINKQINFYNLKNFRSQVHYDAPDPEAQVCMEELKEARGRLLALMQAAQDSGLEVLIESTIQVTLLAKEYTAPLCLEAEAC